MKKTKSNAEDAEAQREESVDLFVLLTRIGGIKGECDAMALNHIDALSRGDRQTALDAGRVLRTRLKELQEEAARAVRLHDAGLLAVYADQLSNQPPINPS